MSFASISLALLAFLAVKNATLQSSWTTYRQENCKVALNKENR